MSKNTNALRKLGAIIKAEPELADENTGYIITYCADEIDRLRGELDSVRESLSNASAYINQACQAAGRANDPENFEI